jgi:MFS family permease
MNRVLFFIVIAQFLCTSLWFAGNAVLPDLILHLHLEEGFLANLTSAVQLGFIAGTLAFALFTISDRFSPSKVFFMSALAAALANGLVTVREVSSFELLALRFIAGFFLAGIYPVGMKIASDYFKEGLGKSLGFLVGALVLGTALPHLLKSMTVDFHWNHVMFVTSGLSVFGGLLILIFVPDGPYRKPGQQLTLTTFLNGFASRKFKSAALGYFGHMWELYAFWAFVPLMLGTFKSKYPDAVVNIPILSFLIIAGGGLSCVMGGWLSQTYKPKPVATLALFLSFVCCLLSPLFLHQSSLPILIAFLFFWGMVVVADSPLFSTLVAQHAPATSRGTALTIVNCIGFAITIISIQVVNALHATVSSQFIYMLLGIGPLGGLIALLRDREHKQTT